MVALFLEDWGLARVALSCHMTMDLLCQEMRDACWEAESMGYPCSLCSQCREAGCTRLGCALSLPRPFVAMNKATLPTVDGL